jgi:hypothetical protein
MLFTLFCQRQTPAKKAGALVREAITNRNTRDLSSPVSIAGLSFTRPHPSPDLDALKGDLVTTCQVGPALLPIGYFHSLTRALTGWSRQ